MKSVGVYLLGFIIFTGVQAHALQISEVMYDAVGTDTDHEWIEIYNNADESISLSNLKLFEANTNHGITVISGGDSIMSGEYAVIAAHAAVFSSTYASFAGILTDSSFSLANTGETLAIKDGDTVLTTATYDVSAGAAGDGNSLSFIDGSWVATSPSPGSDILNDDSATDSSLDETAGTDQSAESNNSVTSYRHDVKIDTTPHYSLTVTTNNPVIIARDRIVFHVVPTRIVADAHTILKSGIYRWNFGDGTADIVQDQKEIVHVYSSPGTYQLVLEYYRDRVTYPDDPLVVFKKRISVVSPHISLMGMQDGAIQLKNNFSEDLNLSNWQLQSNAYSLVFPENTIILSNTTYTFTPKQLGFTYHKYHAVNLINPEGELFATYMPKIATSYGASNHMRASVGEPVLQTNSIAPTDAITASTIDTPRTGIALPFVIIGVLLLSILGALGVITYSIYNAPQLVNRSDYDVTKDSFIPSEEIIELSDD